MRVLVTGTAGFIGYHVAKYLLERGDEVVGVDSVNDYYDVRVKYGRLRQTGIPRDKIDYGIIADSEIYPGYRFVK
ncbi:MAG: GDP-mannose 4,6-dehydratase, partial [Spirochaetota bacterium]|nr:GDP-mannose 4,6-dehydratase [Spirochaetota bacterium]